MTMYEVLGMLPAVFLVSITSQVCNLYICLPNLIEIDSKLDY